MNKSYRKGYLTGLNNFIGSNVLIQKWLSKNYRNSNPDYNNGFRDGLHKQITKRLSCLNFNTFH